MKHHPNVKRTWTLIIPTDTMPAVNNPKGMYAFMHELQEVINDFRLDATYGITGDYVKKEVRITFRYYKTAADFADMWFKARAKILSEAARNGVFSPDPDFPF